jgi:glutathione S-transferase
MITLHHLNNSRSQRVLWLLEEMSLPYKIEFYQRDKKTMLAPPSLRKIHPLGKSPVITDGDAVLAESAAILEYLVDTYGSEKFKPKMKTPAQLRYTYWMHYAESSLMPILLLKLVFDKVASDSPFFIRPMAKAISLAVGAQFINPQIQLHLDYIESELNKNDWFAGSEFSAADIQMSFPLEAAQARGGLNESRPRTMNYLKRIHERPAYKRALEKGGTYEL